MTDSLKIGYLLPTLDDPVTGETHRWPELVSLAQRAEEVGFDTIWVSDEFLWDVPSWNGTTGWWECVAMMGALAASTTTASLGTWVLSSLHRNPGLTAMIVETLDEISNGRFIFGFGSGHAGKVSRGFNYPDDKVVSRYEEALQVILPLVREGTADFSGEFQKGEDAIAAPRGPSNGKIEVMLAGHGPRNMRLAAQHGDTWSAYVTGSSQPEAFAGLISGIEEACAKVGRDPASIGKSVGVFIQPSEVEAPPEVGLEGVISGSVDQMVDTLGRFAQMGFTSVELLGWPYDMRSVEALAPVIAQIKT